MFRKRKIILIVMLSAMAVFVVSALAAGAGVSGYERLKAAGFQLAEQADRADGLYSNGVFEMSTAFYIDGVKIIGTDQTTAKGGGRSITWESSYYGDDSYSPFEFFGPHRSEDYIEYTDDDVTYRWYDDGEFYDYKSYRGKYSYPNADIYADDENRIPPAQRRFIEAVADALIGETRSYFVSEADRVSISLSGNQIPEIAQYAIAAIAERVNHSFTYAGGIMYDGSGEDVFNTGAGTNPDALIGTDARFTSGSLDVGLDGDNNITDAKMTVELLSTVDGKLSSYKIVFEFMSQGVGTTVVPKPDKGPGGKPLKPGIDGSGAFDGAISPGTAVA